MKVVVTFFCCDNGHLNAYDPIKNTQQLINKIIEEFEEIGNDWLCDMYELDDIKKSNGNELLNICENISVGGRLEVITI